jgi:transposase
VPWRPASPAHQRLHALVATRQALRQQLQQLRNREGAAGYTACQALVAELQAPVAAALTAQVARVDRELARLAAAETPLGTQLRALVSIPDLGRTTAATILASLPVERLATRRQVAAYAGLCPRERTSGSSVRGRSRTGPLGPASLRKALYLPAVVAMRANPALRASAERLRAAGKGPKVVVVAVMRKLLELAWTLLRSGQPFSLSQGMRASTP